MLEAEELALLANREVQSKVEKSSIRPDVNGNIGTVQFLPYSTRLLICQSQNCGNYYVAAKRIFQGEVIFEEIATSVSAYGLPDRSPYCLACYKDLAYSQKCTRCRWPICSEVCSAAPQHSNYECGILEKNKVQYRPKKTMMEHLALETLRCLLIRDKNSTAWKQILCLEAHSGPRGDDCFALNETSYVLEFIHGRCNLTGFDEDIVKRMVGIVSINTFNGFPYVGRYASLLFTQASLFNHDCTPNTFREFVETLCESDNSLQFGIQVIAARDIARGEIISTNYGDISAGIVSRGEFLKDHYYFHCDCSRCRCELFNEIHHSPGLCQAVNA